jgi:hypothetical protein
VSGRATGRARRTEQQKVAGNAKVFLTWRTAVLLSTVNSKQRKTLESIFSSPTPKNLPWNEIESLLKALGCKVIEGEGSRVSFRMTLLHDDGSREVFREDFHRPHPGKEAKAYQIKNVGKFLTRMRQAP